MDLSSGRDENTNTLIKVAMGTAPNTPPPLCNSLLVQILKYGDEDIEQLVQSALKEERAMVTMTACIAIHHGVAMAARGCNGHP